MKNYIKHALAIFTAILAFSATSQAQSNPPAWSATTNYQVGDLVTYEGVEFKCLINETTAHPTPHTTYWGISFVYSGPLTIPVGPGQVMTTLQQAWNYISFARIAANSSITLSLESTYHGTLTSSFSLDHPYGSRISIIGADAGASVNFTTTGTGFILDSGDSLAQLAQLTISTPTPTYNGVASIQVSENATLSRLQKVNIRNFDIGLSATDGGTIDNVGTTVITTFVSGGVFAGYNSTINITTPISVVGSPATELTGSYAFNAQGGTLLCNGCTGSDCGTNFIASDGGIIEAANAYSASANGKGTGFFAYNHGSIIATSCTSSGNYTAFVAYDSGYVNAASSKSSGTSTNGYDYFAGEGATVNATGYTGSTHHGTGTNDGSYVYGF